MILAETKYKTYNVNFLAIIKTFKTWWHYWKSCKYKIVKLINKNNPS